MLSRGVNTMTDSVGRINALWSEHGAARRDWFITDRAAESLWFGGSLE